MPNPKAIGHWVHVKISDKENFHALYMYNNVALRQAFAFTAFLGSAPWVADVICLKFFGLWKHYDLIYLLAALAQTDIE